jgi:superfamily II DNA or RNA helicase
MPAVLRAADQRLTEVRRAVPDAGGLVIATDHYAARAYASLLQDITGQQATLVLSDEKAASNRIESFAKSERRWMVAVRMVSEGVDIPRLGVGVYATSASTPLFFAQAIGRYVRARRRGETASVFLPSVPSLTALASALEMERDHALDRVGQVDLLDDSLIVEANRSDPSSPGVYEFDFKAIESSATFERVLFDGAEFGAGAEVGSLEELDFIGIPGLLEPDQVRELLQARQARQSRRAGERARLAQARGETAPAEPAPLYRTLKEQRSLLNSLVRIRARATGEAHALIHAELRRKVGGPAVAQASVAQLQARIDLLRRSPSR